MNYSHLLGAQDDIRPIHFMGIGGAGMAALAELFVRRNLPVTGCDSSPNEEVINDLTRIGIDVVVGHNAEHIKGARALVVTSAIPKDHPEIAAAKEAGIPVIRRAEALSAAVSGGTVIGIAGTHGKTTTTVMTTVALTAAGLLPTGIVGGRVNAWNGNLSPGGNDLYVVEADEYDRSFLALKPDIAVVTSVETDHMDVYDDFEDIHGAFSTYIQPARAIVFCDDDNGAASLNLPSPSEILRYGIESPDARVIAHDIELSAETAAFNVSFDGEDLGRVRLAVPGRHNILNALGAISVGLYMGADFAKMAQGLAEFTGVERRFQFIGEIDDIIIIDDYAHHPTEVSATLEAAREGYPDRRIIAAFQPHLYTRTRDFAHDFAVSLALADEILIANIYPAREMPIEGITSHTIADHIAEIGAGGQLEWVGPRSEVANELVRLVEPGDLVITMGAGDITKSSRELYSQLQEAKVKSPYKQ